MPDLCPSFFRTIHNQTPNKLGFTFEDLDLKNLSQAGFMRLRQAIPQQGTLLKSHRTSSSLVQLRG